MENYIGDNAISQRNSRSPIRVSYFNREDSTLSWTFKHWGEGICFQTTRQFEVGATVLIRACHRKRLGACNARQIPPNTLGVVKWCREISGAVPRVYEVGVRFYLSEL